MKTATLYLSFVLFLVAVVNACAFVSRSGPASTTKSSPLRMTLLTYGNKKKDFKPGTPLKKAVAQLGIKPKYSCNK
jgi:hypothetical protein